MNSGNSLNGDSRPPVATTPATDAYDDRTRSKDGSLAWKITIAFGILILIPSMLGFVMKFGDLMTLSQGTNEDGGFAITPVINYLMASLGFFFLLMWAAVNGMFRDLEQPKYSMLENERKLDSHV